MGDASVTSAISMRLIILTLAAFSAMAVAERTFNLCAREEKICPGGVKPRTPCADNSSPRCPSGRTDTCKPKWKRCADRSKPVRQCVTGKPHCPWTTKNRHHPWNSRAYVKVRVKSAFDGGVLSGATVKLKLGRFNFSDTTDKSGNVKFYLNPNSPFGANGVFTVSKRDYQTSTTKKIIIHGRNSFTISLQATEPVRSQNRKSWKTFV